ncbi:MAG: MBL fold metallo-hydrolase [Patescibacteria group bacterium]|nr:MBL fold metallo-hydrolase [Patescibacteria group bacterium]
MAILNDWFTVEKIDGRTFAISEYDHWLEPHSYLFIGDKMAALIDSGLGVGNIKEIVDKLTDLPILVVATHAHPDHLGGADNFLNLAVHEDDLELLKNGLPRSMEDSKKSLFRKPFRKNPPQDFKDE